MGESALPARGAPRRTCSGVMRSPPLLGGSIPLPPPASRSKTVSSETAASDDSAPDGEEGTRKQPGGGEGGARRARAGASGEGVPKTPVPAGCPAPPPQGGSGRRRGARGGAGGTGGAPGRGRRDRAAGRALSAVLKRRSRVPPGSPAPRRGGNLERAGLGRSRSRARQDRAGRPRGAGGGLPHLGWGAAAVRCLGADGRSGTCPPAVSQRPPGPCGGAAALLPVRAPDTPRAP